LVRKGKKNKSCVCRKKKRRAKAILLRFARDRGREKGTRYCFLLGVVASKGGKRSWAGYSKRDDNAPVLNLFNISSVKKEGERGGATSLRLRISRGGGGERVKASGGKKETN